MLALFLALVVPPAPATPAPPADGRALLQQMHERYRGKWYRTLTFVQTTTDFRANTVETWYEAGQIPGRLRIDIAPLDSGRAILFRNDSIYQFAAGAIKAQAAFVHPLMVLGFDVYADSPERTAGKLERLGFDLSRIREDTWQGRPVYVVGAAAGDSTTKQFWVDRERLLFVRMVEPSRSGNGAIVETQFNRYQPLGRGWIAVEVLFNVNGKTVTKEEYADVRSDVNLPAELFEPGKFARPVWMQ